MNQDNEKDGRDDKRYYCENEYCYDAYITNKLQRSRFNTKQSCHCCCKDWHSEYIDASNNSYCSGICFDVCM